MKSQKISGKIVHKDIEGGLWGIVTQEGTEYQLVNMPEQLKSVGSEVTIKIRIHEDAVTSGMWGQPAEVVSFSTLQP